MSIVWSYSSLKTFQQCPKKYYHTRVLKDIKQDNTEHMVYGNEMHKAAEEYIRDNKPLPPQFLYLTELLEALNKIPGEKLCEVKMGIAKVNNKYQPCDFFAKNVWWRGVADLLIINGDTAYSIDYKTSKNAKYADTTQLDLVAAAIFQHYPEVTRVKSALAYVVSKDFIKKDHEKILKTAYIEKVKFDVERIETATETGVWNAVAGPLCGWCPVKTCHNYKERR